MRNKERIPLFFELVDWDKLSKRWGLEGNIQKHILNHIPFIDVKKYWLNNPDQRIGQVLINLNLLQDDFSIWIDEEADILKDQGIELRNFLFWTSRYDEHNNLLDEPITKLIKDLDTNHLPAILNWAADRKVGFPKYYKETLIEEIERRKRLPVKGFDVDDHFDYHVANEEKVCTAKIKNYNLGKASVETLHSIIKKIGHD